MGFKGNGGVCGVCSEPGIRGRGEMLRGSTLTSARASTMSHGVSRQGTKIEEVEERVL
jgi:hypothetical protein